MNVRTELRVEADRFIKGRVGLLLFAITFLCYAFFYQAGGWNQNCRFDLTRALVEEQSFKIDLTHENTGDKARRGEHYYCEKAPLVSFLAVPAHATADLFLDEEPTDRQLNTAAYVSSVFAVALPAALAVVVFFRLTVFLGLSTRAAAGFSLAWSLGTMAFPYSTNLYGHQVCASLLLVSAYLMIRGAAEGEKRSRWRMSAAGAALGLAFAAEYAGAVGIACLLLYAVFAVRDKRALLWIAVGAALSLLPLLLYHWVAFGSPFKLAYHYSIHGVRHAGVFMGIGLPSPRALFGITFSEYRGLFVSAPWLLAAVPGFLFLVRRKRTRAIALASAGVCLSYLWLNASIPDWRAGWGMGPRFMIAALPFWSLLAAGIWLRLQDLAEPTRKLVTTLLLAAVAVSIVLMLIASAVGPEVPGTILEPFRAYLIPQFAAGELAVNTQSIDALHPGTGRAAWNWGQRIGLPGLWSLSPLLLGVLVLAGLVHRALGQNQGRQGS